MPLIPIPRVKHNVQNNYNINISDNARIDAIASENVTDNSVNSFNSIATELFEQVRTTVKELNSEYKNELLDILAKIEQTKNAGDKKECGNVFGKFISLASIADCITVAQPLVPLFSWLFNATL